MIATLIIIVGLFIVLSGFALGMFVISAVMGHSWSVNDYLRNKAHQRHRQTVRII